MLIPKKIVAMMSIAMLMGGYTYSTLAADDHSPITEPIGVKKNNVAPNVMLVVGRDHNLYTEAYSDYTPLNDKTPSDLFIMYHPDFTYEGLYSYDLCYKYENNLWIPQAHATSTDDILKCGNKMWLGNFLNYLTASRMDVIKTVLYGGTRIFENDKQKYYNWDNNHHSAILSHTIIPADSHSWGKVFANRMYQNQTDVKSVSIEDISSLDNYNGTDGRGAYFFGVTSIKQKTKLRIVQVSDALAPGNTDGTMAIWNWVSQESGDTKNFRNSNKDSDDRIVNGSATDFFLNVVACNPDTVSANNNICQEYISGNERYYQPEGIIQEFGTTKTNDVASRLNFGLITGGWSSNRAGGVLRSNIGDKSSSNSDDSLSEYNTTTGELLLKKCDVGGGYCGIAGALDRFAIRDIINGGDIGVVNGYGADCGRNGTTLKQMNNDENTTCSDWGNPIGELLAQSVNYFMGNEVKNNGISKDVNSLGIGCVKEKNPYSKENYCAKAISFIISDEGNSFDSFARNQPNLYPSFFSPSSIENALDAFNVKGSYLAGLSKSATIEEQRYNAIPTIKTVNSLKDIEGIAPVNAFSYGSYNVAGVASIALGQNEESKPLSNKNITNKFNMQTYVLAMKPNIAEIKLDVDGTEIRIIPFAKTPADRLDNGGVPYVKYFAEDDASKNQLYWYQSTNQVADFYVQRYDETSGSFRINYEDFEYGSDYDMDWIVGYDYKILTGQSGDKYVYITMKHLGGDPYAPQHAGYIITGVKYSGAYIDLGKSTAENDQGNQGNVYALDNYISDPFFWECQDSNSTSELKTCLLKDYPSTTTRTINCPNGYRIQQVSCNNWGCNCYRGNDYRWTGWTTVTPPNTDPEVTEQRISSDVDGYFNKIEKLKNSENIPYYYLPRYKLVSIISELGNDAYYNNRIRIIGDYPRVNNNANGHNITYSSRLFKVQNSGDDANDVWLKSPIWYAAKAGNTVAQRDNPNVTNLTNYSYVTNPSQFRTNMRTLINTLLASYHTGSSFVPETRTTSEGTAVYASAYNPTNWFGNLYKAKVGSDASYDYTSFNNCGFDGISASCSSGSTWNAAYQFAQKSPEERLIVTYSKEDNKLKRVYAAADTLTESINDTANSARALMGDDLFQRISTFGDATTSDARTRMNGFVRWLAGDDKYEGTVELVHDKDTSSDAFIRNVGYFRERKENGIHFVLGDIINSDATLITVNGARFLAVGANDGMLHIIDETNGAPVVSFIPYAVQPLIYRTSDLSYSSAHMFLVDSTPQKISKNRIHGTLGLNVKGGYLLDLSGFESIKDITDGTARFAALPSSFYQWEILDENNTANTDKTANQFVGKSREAGIFLSTKTGEYIAYSSGFDATTPGIYIVNVKNPVNGEPVFASTIDLSYDKVQHTQNLPTISSNKPKAITPIDIITYYSNGVSKPYVMYVGDNYGVLYRIVLSSLKGLEDKPSCWGLTRADGCLFEDDISGKNLAEPWAIFVATDKNGNPQPITARITASLGSESKTNVVFGTGSYWTRYDSSSTSLNDEQTIYIIKDKFAQSTLTRSDIAQAQYNNDGACEQNEDTGYAVGQCHRTGSITDVASNATKDKLKKGWFFDVQSFTNKKVNVGERVYRSALILDQTAYITSIVPNLIDPCETGGRSYLYVLDLLAGSFELQKEVRGVANEMTTTIQGGNIYVHVTSSDSSASIPNTDEPIKHGNNSPVKETSWIRLY